MVDVALAATWRKYRGWAARARVLREELDRGHRWALTLTVAGALSATLAARWGVWYPGPSGETVVRLLSALSGIAMAVAAWLVKSIADPGRERQWVRARALAEAAKSEAYRYVAALPPYDAADPGAQLLGRMQDLITKNDDVPAVEVSEDEAARGVPAQPMSAADYAQSRAEEQELKFFRPSAAKNERLASRYALLTQGLTGLAAVLGALGAIYTAYGIEAWVATLGTIATAIGAYALGQRYQRLAATYQVTADRLGLRRAAWALASAKGPSADIDRAFVADIEAILAAENQSWMADRIK